MLPPARAVPTPPTAVRQLIAPLEVRTLSTRARRGQVCDRLAAHPVPGLQAAPVITGATRAFPARGKAIAPLAGPRAAARAACCAWPGPQPRQIGPPLPPPGGQLIARWQVRILPPVRAAPKPLTAARQPDRALEVRTLITRSARPSAPSTAARHGSRALEVRRPGPPAAPPSAIAMLLQPGRSSAAPVITDPHLPATDRFPGRVRMLTPARRAHASQPCGQLDLSLEVARHPRIRAERFPQMVKSRTSKGLRPMVKNDNDDLPDDSLLDGPFPIEAPVRIEICSLCEEPFRTRMDAEIHALQREAGKLVVCPRPRCRNWRHASC